MPPRLVLMITALDFIIANCSLPISPRVSPVSGTWMLTTSEVRSNSSNPTFLAPNSSSSSAESSAYLS